MTIYSIAIHNADLGVLIPCIARSFEELVELIRTETVDMNADDDRPLPEAYLARLDAELNSNPDLGHHRVTRGPTEIVITTVVL